MIECRVKGHDWFDAMGAPAPPDIPGEYHCERCGTELTVKKNGKREYRYPAST